MSKGYEAVSLADVAAHAGLARTAIYNYFPDREALLFAWTEREVRRTLAILGQEIAEAPTCAEKLRIFVRLQLVDFASRHLPPGHEVIQFLRPETFELFMQHVGPVEQVLRDILAEGIESGEFAGVDAGDAVPMILACIGSERAPIASKTHTVDEATDRVANFLLRALTAGAGDTGDRPKPARTPKAPTKRRAKSS